jgi:hypothetical protein
MIDFISNHSILIFHKTATSGLINGSRIEHTPPGLWRPSILHKNYGYFHNKYVVINPPPITFPGIKDPHGADNDQSSLCQGVPSSEIIQLDSYTHP